MGHQQDEDWLPQVCGGRMIVELFSKSHRFFIHKSIQRFAAAILEKHGREGEEAMLFPTHATAARCREFILRQAPDVDASKVRILDLVPAAENARSEELAIISPKISAVFFPQDHFKIAKAFWQHSGDGVSSRRAEYCHHLFNNGFLVDASSLGAAARPCKGPRRYQKQTSIDLSSSTNGSLADLGDPQDSTSFVEERFGRNLELSKTKNAKLAIRRRIAGSLTADVALTEAIAIKTDNAMTRKVAGFSEKDVYLYPTGMSSIFNAHRNILAAKGPLKAIVYGYVQRILLTTRILAHDYRFPYIDTLKITEKFGAGSLFYGFGSSEELDDLEKRLEGGERFMALFTEFPGNPLLRSPDLERIRKLADKYDFCVVVDETIGNFINVNVLPYADVVVSSLTKVFSGDSNVMGGG